VTPGAQALRGGCLSLQGCTIAETSGQLGSSERTVYRRLERIKARLQRLRRGEDPSG
jgi:hypothetical protein